MVFSKTLVLVVPLHILSSILHYNPLQNYNLPILIHSVCVGVGVGMWMCASIWSFFNFCGELCCNFDKEYIELNLYIAFGKMIIFTMLIPPMHEHGQSFYVSSMSFLTCSKVFTCLIRVISRYFWDIFLGMFVFCIKKDYWFLCG